jgi:hypothetical protein
MFHGNLTLRTLEIGAFVAAVLLCATPGTSEPQKISKAAAKDRRACKEAFKTAQQLEQSAHLRQARDSLQWCAKANCSAFVRQECTRRYAQLGSDIPSVVPIVTDAAGVPRVDVQVTMDGEVLTSRLDGRALPVDPGLHEFSFSIDGGVIATQKVMIVQGQRNQPISVVLRSTDKRGQKRPIAASVTLPARLDAKTAVLEKPALDSTEPEKATPEKAAAERAPAGRSEKTADNAAPDGSFDDTPTEAKPKSGPPTLAYLLGGVGLAGVGAGTLLVYWGRNDNQQLVAQCKPDCSPASVNHVRKTYLAADIALGAGIAALGVSTILFATSGSKETPPSHSAYAIQVNPTPSGAFATVSGSF